MVVGSIAFIACALEPIPEMRPEDGPDAGATPEPAEPQPLACDEPVAQPRDGEHNPGQPCLECHTEDGEGPPFSIGGTLYRDLVGSSAIAGATIRIGDATGRELPLITARNGNFWTEEPVTYPVQAIASSCPDARQMIAPIQAGGGDCNRAGCHASSFRVSLP
jgi:hypothetical protein